MTLIEPLTRAALDSHCGDAEACRTALRDAAAQQKSLVATVLDGKLADETPFLQGVASWLKMPWWGESLETISAPLRDKVPARLALRHRVVPVKSEADGLTLVTFDPFDLLARQTVARAVDEPIHWAMATRTQILQTLRQGYGIGAETFEEIMEGRDVEDLALDMREETQVLDMDDSEASVVKFVNQILREALEERATDIHVEPLQDDLQIRYRIDGVLHDIPVPPKIKVLQASVISRLKIMAHLDIAERRLPQDGRIPLELEGKPIDVRVATIPSVSGESVSLRLLGQEQFTFARLGLDAASEEKIRALLAMPNGIVLVTGPTGCGKSTSLYTVLTSLNTKVRRIVTIEDPVEH